MFFRTNCRSQSSSWQPTHNKFSENEKGNIHLIWGCLRLCTTDDGFEDAMYSYPGNLSCMYEEDIIFEKWGRVNFKFFIYFSSILWFCDSMKFSKFFPSLIIPTDINLSWQCFQRMLKPGLAEKSIICMFNSTERIVDWLFYWSYNQCHIMTFPVSLVYLAFWKYICSASGGIFGLQLLLGNWSIVMTLMFSIIKICLYKVLAHFVKVCKLWKLASEENRLLAFSRYKYNNNPAMKVHKP